MGSPNYTGPVYTPETHPYRGQVFKGWPPGTYYLDGKRYCPTSWIVSHPTESHTAGVLNTQQECEELVKSWGATVEWQSDTSPMAIAQGILAWMQQEPDYAAQIMVDWIRYIKAIQSSAMGTQANLRSALENEKKAFAEYRARVERLRASL